MAITIVSLLVLTGAAWLANRALPFLICPICAAVSGTWLWLCAASVFGLLPAAAYQPFILLLMGGTVVGVAYQGERSFAWAGRWPLLWKTAIISIGIPAAFWAVALASPATLALEATALAALAYFFFVRRAAEGGPRGEPPMPARVKELEDKLEQCC
ncbi:MAG: hypothetical protein A3B37_02045 [Candidatus Sungbacteria bacterium RIFCSPLOWO2_01_FULL_59_16]|uniref:Uncharacterized protein n=1 Tax=Candidatus Sungbacteria bacterium RIFCSPLOWO2_01_FULL_59_16 TaxID=1802280 RepID=A0A1G2LF63_9BACT|nr:MAG: hypothetical protein A3B37_02045 [Candidatus Sungbacteria bacterium RIFCSPLOWO2_01_FULL_59_16]